MIPQPIETMTAVRDAARAYIKKEKTAEEQMWEQRRYEIAKAMLPSIYRSFKGTPLWQCETAVMFADTLIAELKGGKK